MKNRLFIWSLIGLFFCSCSSPKTDEKTDDCTNVKHVEWSRNAVIYEVNIRQYTPEGTFNAFAEHLPQLKELGVDILWLMPVGPVSELNRKGTLGSYYAVQNYTDVNPEFGTMDDFKALVNKAHELGFKVILDWVANHSGCDNVWTVEHPDWYVRDEAGNFISPYDWTDTYKFDYTNPEMRAAMTDALKFWVSECDVDGYRCDVAFEVPTDFWNNARKELDAIKPVFMLAEAEHADLTEEAFDMVYNWPLKNLITLIAQGKEPEVNHDIHVSPVDLGPGLKTSLDIDRLIAKQKEAFPCDAYQMNHITNHDLNSWEGSEFVRFGNGANTFAVLSYILPGMPLIYTGQEVGMDKTLEFFEKDTVPSWEKNETFAFYQKLNELKHSNPALRAGVEGGDLVRIHTSNDEKIAIYSREKDGEQVIAILNLSNETVEYTLTEAMEPVEYTNFFTKEKVNELPLAMEAWGYTILVK